MIFSFLKSIDTLYAKNTRASSELHPSNDNWRYLTTLVVTEISILDWLENTNRRAIDFCKLMTEWNCVKKRKIVSCILPNPSENFSQVPFPRLFCAHCDSSFRNFGKTQSLSCGQLYSITILLYRSSSQGFFCSVSLAKLPRHTSDIHKWLVQSGTGFQ